VLFPTFGAREMFVAEAGSFSDRAPGGLQWVMKKLIAMLAAGSVAAAIVGGCAQEVAADATPTEETVANSDGITQITPSPTPMAPVVGTESLQGGGGGGVGQAAKDRARGLGGAAPSSLSQASDE
jgi:hypothetical protein